MKLNNSMLAARSNGISFCSEGATIALDSATSSWKSRFTLRSLVRRPASTGRARSSRVGFASLLAPALLAIPALPAQDQNQILINVQGEYGGTVIMQRFDVNAVGVSPLLSSTQLNAIPTTHRVRGITPIDGSGTILSKVIIYTEESSGNSHLWKVDFVMGTAAIGTSPLLWGAGFGAIRPADMVGFARTPHALAGVLGFSPTDAWHLTVTADGDLFGPALEDLGPLPFGPVSTPGSGTLPLPGPCTGVTRHNDHWFAVSGADVLRLNKGSVGSGSNLLPPATNVVLESWIIPVTGQVLGFTLSDDGYFYALVNRVSDSNEQTTGYVELVRSIEPVDAYTGALELQSIGTHIEDWNNGGADPLLFPPANLAFGVAPFDG